MRKYLAALLVLALMGTLGVAGCGSKGEPEAEVTPQEPAAAAATTAPSAPQREATSAPTAVVGAGASPAVPAAPTSASEPSAGLAGTPDSYRSETTMAKTVDGTVTEAWTVTLDYVRDPLARHYTVVEMGVPEFELIQIAGVSYLGSGGEWTAMLGAESLSDVLPAGVSMSPEYAEGPDCEARGSEEVNGYRAVHYICALEGSLTGLVESLPSAELQDVASEMWVSEEHGVVVKGFYTYTVKNADGKAETMRMETNVTMINEPITIEAPAGVAAPEVVEGVPLMEGATDLFAMGLATVYTVKDKTPADVQAWYLDAMQAAGWEYDEEGSTPPDDLEFTKEGRLVAVLLSASDGDTSVTIVEQEQ